MQSTFYPCYNNNNRKNLGVVAEENYSHHLENC